MDINDLMTLKALEKDNGMTPYEAFKTQHMQAKSHTSGIGVAGLVLGTVGTAVGVGAWLFGGMYGSAKANQAKEAAIGAKELANTQYTAALQLMNQQNANTNATIDRLLTTVAAERAERIAGDVTISQNITDSISGQQQGSQTSSQTTAIDNTVQQLMQQTLSDAITGRSALAPQAVSLYSAPQPCSCPGSCGCNG